MDISKSSLSGITYFMVCMFNCAHARYWAAHHNAVVAQPMPIARQAGCPHCDLWPPLCWLVGDLAASNVRFLQ